MMMLRSFGISVAYLGRAFARLSGSLATTLVVTALLGACAHDVQVTLPDPAVVPAVAAIGKGKSITMLRRETAGAIRALSAACGG